MRRLLLLTTALIVYGSLYPWHFHFVSGSRPWWVLLHGWPQRLDLWTLRDTILNIALYAPLGFAGMATAMRGRSKAAALLLTTAGGAALSASMELLQVYVPGRVCSVADLVTNIIGTALGAGLAIVFAGRIGKLKGMGLRRVDAAALLLAAVFGCYRLYPFFPVLGRTRAIRGISAMLHLTSASPVEIWVQAGEWMAFAAVAEYAWKRMGRRWLMVVMLVLPLQWILLDRNFTLDELLGAVLALAIFCLTGTALRAQIALGMLGSGIVLRELLPFQLLTRPQPFNWIPFAATFSSGRDTSVVIIAGKAFDYGALVWLLRRVGAPFWPGAIAAAAVLMALEWFQRLLPGRTPESTDAALTLVMALALWMLKRERHA